MASYWDRFHATGKFLWSDVPGDREKGIQEMEELCTLDPNQYWSYYNLGLVYLWRCKPPRTEDAERCVTIACKNGKGHADFDENADVQTGIRDALAECRKRRENAGNLLICDPDFAERFWALVKQANELAWMQKDYREACVRFETLNSMYAGHWIPHYNLAVLNLYHCNPRNVLKSLAAVEKFFALLPTFGTIDDHDRVVRTCRTVQCACYLLTGDVARAVEHCRYGEPSDSAGWEFLCRRKRLTIRMNLDLEALSKKYGFAADQVVRISLPLEHGTAGITLENYAVSSTELNTLFSAKRAPSGHLEIRKTASATRFPKSITLTMQVIAVPVSFRNKQALVDFQEVTDRNDPLWKFVDPSEYAALKDDVAFHQLVRDVTAPFNTLSEKVEAILTHIRSNYTWDALQALCKPSEMLKRGKGDCFTFSLMGMSALRVLNIPARCVYGIVVQDPPCEHPTHFICYAYSVPLKSWVPIEVQSPNYGISTALFAVPFTWSKNTDVLYRDDDSVLCYDTTMEFFPNVPPTSSRTVEYLD
eukprot:ANDGO_02898.mRNA.1 hypothetical protein